MNVPVTSEPSKALVVAVNPAPRLRVADRCDRCRAQAFVEVAIPVVLHEVGPTIRETVDESDLPGAWEASDLSGGQDEIRTTLPLLFCAHHFREYEPNLPPGSGITADDRHTLQPKPTTGPVY